MPRVDIVIPLYNKARCIERAIESIRAQTMTDWRLIVVDDGSTDGGADIVRAIADERIELIQQKNAGPGAARNAGIEKAKSKYIAFLDADDEWYKWYLKNAIEAIEREDVAMVSSMYCLWPGKQDMTGHWAKQKVSPGVYSLKGNEDPVWVDFLLNFPHVWNSLMYTEVASKYDGFYEKDRCMLGEDTVFFLRIGINERFAITDEIGVCHHTEDSDLANSSKRPLAPFLSNPGIVLDYCGQNKRELMRSVIDHMAVRFAREKARGGLKKEATELLQSFPGADSYRWEYLCCRCSIIFSRWLPCWVKFKCAVGPPVRFFLRSLARKLHLIPDIPETRFVDNSRQDNE